MKQSTGTELNMTDITNLRSKISCMFKSTDQDMRRLAAKICHAQRIPYYVMTYFKDHKKAVVYYLDPLSPSLTVYRGSERRSNPMGCVYNFYYQHEDHPSYLITWDKKEKELSRCSRVVMKDS